MAEKPGKQSSPEKSGAPTPSSENGAGLAPFFLGALLTAAIAGVAFWGWQQQQQEPANTTSAGAGAPVTQAPSGDPAAVAAEALPAPEPEPVVLYESEPAPLQARLEAIREEFRRAEKALTGGDHDLALVQFRTGATLTRELLESTNLNENRSAVENLLAHAHRAAGEILFETARYDQAIEQYSNALEVLPDSGFLLARRGQCYLAQEEAEKAARDIEAAVKRESEDAVVLTAYGQLTLKKEGATGKALAVLDRALARDGSVAETRFWRGKVLAEKGDPAAMDEFRKAAEGFSQTLEARPGALRWRSCRSSCYIQIGEFSRAVGDLNIYLATRNTDAAAYANRGYALLKVGRARDAVEDFFAALALDPQMNSAYINRGDAFMRLGKLPEAIADYDKALEFSPENPVAWHNRGMAYRQKGDFDKALEDLQKARELDPDSNMILHGIGSIYLSQAMFQRAVDLYDVILERDPADALAHASRGTANFATGFYQDALEDFTHAIENGARKPEIFGRRAVAWNMMGQPDKALEDLDEAIQINPEDPRLYTLRGSIRHYVNDHEGSMADMRKAMELDGSNVAASDRLDLRESEVAN